MTLAATRDLLSDDRIWNIAARVATHDNESIFWKETDEGAIMVSVRTLQHGVPLWAILAGGDINSEGFWKIPDLGTEVVIAIENGDVENEAYLTGLLGKYPPTPREFPGGDLPGGGGSNGSSLSPTLTLAVGEVIELRTLFGNEIVQIAAGSIVIKAALAFLGTNVGAEAPLKGDTYNSAVSDLLTALTTALSSAAGGTWGTGGSVAWGTAVASFLSAATAAKASKARVA